MGTMTLHRHGRVPLASIVVWALSFPGAGSTAAEAVPRMREALQRMRFAAGHGTFASRRHGLTWVRWEVEDDGSWFVHEIASFPRGRGHGTRLLEQLLTRADALGVPVQLVCPPGRVEWYARHGFRTRHRQPANVRRLGLVALRRPAAVGVVPLAVRRRPGPARRLTAGIAAAAAVLTVLAGVHAETTHTRSTLPARAGAHHVLVERVGTRHALR